MNTAPVILGADGRFLATDNSGLEVLGYGRGLHELTWRDITHPDDVVISKRFLEVARVGEAPTLLKRCTAHDGRIVTVRIRATWDGSNFVSYVEDSPDEVITEASLSTDLPAVQPSSARWRAAILSIDGMFIRVTNTAYDLLGYGRRIWGMRIEDYTYPDDVAACLDWIKRALMDMAGTEFINKRFVCANGDLVYARLVAAPVRDRGRVQHFKILWKPTRTVAQPDPWTCVSCEIFRECQGPCLKFPPRTPRTSDCREPS